MLAFVVEGFVWIGRTLLKHTKAHVTGWKTFLKNLKDGGTASSSHEASAPAAETPDARAGEEEEE
jgi:hypothetical protein